MELVHILMTGLTAIILFIFGLENFSLEIQRITGESFRRSISRLTKLPIIGVLLGAIVTAVIQSSSATSVITISLVNAGVLSFKNSVGIVFGANIGTTITAQLVAFKLTAFAPFIIIVGFLLSLLNSRASVFGKAIFYFGFVFFTLNLISSSLQPLQANGWLVDLLSRPQNPLITLLLGCVFTALVQSSSVTTGLAIIFTQQGILGLENAVPLIMGANIGTTATALIAMFSMDAAAKKTALSHFLFNTGGVLMFLPPLLLFGDRLSEVSTDPAIALATIHLVFNTVTTVIFLLFINSFTRFVNWLLGEGKMDFERLELPTLVEDDDFASIRRNLDVQAGKLLLFLQENYNQVTLALETNYRGIFESAGRRIDYVNFLHKEYLDYFSRVVSLVHGDRESREVMRVFNRFDYLFQVHDSIEDIHNAKRVLSEHYLEPRSDVLLLIREISSDTLSLFDDIARGLDGKKELNVHALSEEIQQELNQRHRTLLSLLADPLRKDVGALTNFITYSQRLKDKLVNYAKVSLAAKEIPRDETGAG